MLRISSGEPGTRAPFSKPERGSTLSNSVLLIEAAKSKRRLSVRSAVTSTSAPSPVASPALTMGVNPQASCRVVWMPYQSLR